MPSGARPGGGVSFLSVGRNTGAIDVVVCAAVEAGLTRVTPTESTTAASPAAASMATPHVNPIFCFVGGGRFADFCTDILPTFSVSHGCLATMKGVVLAFR